jgi:hypothetical protein
MRRAALVVVLSLFFPLLAFAQHHSSEGASSSSSASSSSGGSSNFSAGSSSSGSTSSHSSSSAGSGSSSSGNHSGGSEGLRAGSVSPSSSHTGSSSAVSHSGLASGNSVQSNPLQSKLKSGDAGSEHANRNNSPLAGGADSGLASTSSASSRLASVAGEAWMQEPIRLHQESGDMNKALREGRFDAELRELGLEPTKEAYRARLASLGDSDKAIAQKKPNWVAKTFLGKPDGDGEAARPKSCKGKHCKPVPPPPGPHPIPPPAPIVGSGEGFCWGYLERCDRQGNCYAHLRAVNYSSCDELLRQLKLQEGLAADLKNTQQSACAADSQSLNCAAAASDLQKAESRVINLRKQYKMCLTAAMPLLSRDLPLLQSILDGGP